MIDNSLKLKQFIILDYFPKSEKMGINLQEFTIITNIPISKECEKITYDFRSGIYLEIIERDKKKYRVKILTQDKNTWLPFTFLSPKAIWMELPNLKSIPPIDNFL